MLWCTYQVRSLLEDQRKLKQMQGGSYAGLELHGIHEVMETQEDESPSLEIPSPTKEQIDALGRIDRKKKTKMLTIVKSCRRKSNKKQEI